MAIGELVGDGATEETLNEKIIFSLTSIEGEQGKRTKERGLLGRFIG